MKGQDEKGKIRTTRRLFAVITVVIASLITLVVAELLVRVVLPYNTPDTVRAYSLEYEPAVYARSLLKPVNRLVEVDSAKAWGDKAQDEASDVAVFISSNGYRGPAFAVRKPAQTKRIIVLGGSAVFDHGAPDRNPEKFGSWPHLLEDRLHEEGFENVEVINAGIPGHATSDSLGRLVTQLWMYSPDFVLVYHGWNDIKFWRAQEISPETPLISQVTPYDPSSNPFISYRGFWDKLLSNSQIYVKLRSRFFMSRIDIGLEGAVNAPSEMASEYETYGPEQFRLNLELIVSASKIIGATPVIVTQATLVAPNNSPADQKRINYDYQKLEHEALVNAFDETYEIIRDIGSRTGVPIIDAAPSLNGSSEHFADHIHLSLSGSHAVAEIVADGLAPMLNADSSTEN